MKDSLFDLLSLASSTKFKILDAVELLKVLFTFTFNTPDIFTQPDMTESPNATSLGTLSPVSATVFKLELPSITSPSSGIFSPGLITTTSPTAIVEGFTTIDSPFLKTLAVSGCISIRSEMESRVLSLA